MNKNDLLFQDKLMKDVYLKDYTSFRIGGKSDYFIKPSTIKELKDIIDYAKKEKIQFFILGKGSNILVSDSGFNGMIILMTGISQITLEEDNIINAQSGAHLARLSAKAYEYGLSGAEYFFGIPGTVGGAVYMNAGAYGGEIKDCLLSCTFLDEDNNIVTLYNEQLNFSYRKSYFSNKKCVILSSKFKLNKGNKVDIKNKMDEFMQKRIAKQPLEFPSAGSVFKRPQGNYTGALVDKAGLRGFSIGGAQVSEKHSGFIINHNSATAKDVVMLIEHIQNEVYKHTGYQLECEVYKLGF